MKYKYIPENAQFVRCDNRGRRFNIEWVDAVQVATLTEDGYSVEYIHKKLGLDSDKMNLNNLSSFVRIYRQGDIINLDPRDYENLHFYNKIRDKFSRWLNG